MSTARGAGFAQIGSMLERTLNGGRSSPLEHEIYEILKLAGFRVPRSLFVASDREIDALDIGVLPGTTVVCKLISPAMPHRTEHGGIRFVKRTKRAIAGTYRDFAAIASRVGFELSGMLIAEKIEGADCIPHQLLISLRQDPSFGPIVFLGLGGVGTEIFAEGLTEERGLFVRAAADVADRSGMERALGRTLFYPIIAGRTRISAKPLAKLERIHEALSTFAMLGAAFSPTSRDSSVTIEELEVNPLQITAEGDCVPLDAMMRVSRDKYAYTPPPKSLIGRLLEPKSALIIGASATKMNVGRIILKNLIRGGGVPRERIYLLHPEANEIDGCRAFRSVNDLPEKVDMTVFTIPADEKSATLLEELIAGEKTSTITLISAGFGETDKGRELDRRLRATIRGTRERPTGGVAVNGPNCMGIVSKPGGYNTFFLPEYKLPFRGAFGERCAVVTQSGAYLVTLISNLDGILNPKYMITYGNQIDVSATDYLITLKDDPAIKLFCLYIEGLAPLDGARFLAVARDIIASGRNIILYKAGRTEAGATAVASHTASMAGNYEVLHKIFLDAGIIMPETLDDVEDTIKVFILLEGKRVTGGRIGIFSNAGFECSVAADMLGSLGLARFSDETVEKLRQALPTDIIDVHNPVDATPLTNAVNYGRCLEAILADPHVDCLMAANVAPTPFMENLAAGEGHSEDILHENSYPNVTIRVFKKTEKPMVACLNSGKLYDPAVRMVESAGIPCFRKIDRAMRALDLFIRHTKRTA